MCSVAGGKEIRAAQRKKESNYWRNCTKGEKKRRCSNAIRSPCLADCLLIASRAPCIIASNVEQTTIWSLPRLGSSRRGCVSQEGTSTASETHYYYVLYQNTTVVAAILSSTVSFEYRGQVVSVEHILKWNYNREGGGWEGGVIRVQCCWLRW